MSDRKDTTNDTNDSAGLHGGFVALVGQPNVGKSTLLNHILGVKVAIATSKPQTTRTRILGVKTYPGKGQICFVDTPGIHRSKRALNQAMNQTALSALEEVDVICHLVDAAALVAHMRREKTNALPPEEAYVQQRLEKVEARTFLVINKVDLVADKRLLLPLIEALSESGRYEEIVPVSAQTGDNVERLTELLLATLPETEHPLFPEDMITDQAERFLAAEFVREQVMIQTRKEVPYSVAVEVEKFVDDPRKDILEISAVIHVERDTQKGILIGEGGKRLKQIGIESRRQMEDFFGRRVFLETFVRVERDWTENPRHLHRFGYK